MRDKLPISRSEVGIVLSGGGLCTGGFFVESFPLSKMVDKFPICGIGNGGVCASGRLFDRGFLVEPFQLY